MKFKIITGFRADQQFIIDADDVHKAYYLFINPEKRTIFSNGVAMIGQDIRGIEPAWNETMGWNPSHKLNGDDWNEIRQKGIDKEMKVIQETAKQLAYSKDLSIFALPMNAIKLLD
jgi:hypothetical protein